MRQSTFLSVLGAVLLVSLGTSAGHSIMDIINTEQVERLLAERRENSSREQDLERKLLLENTVDGVDAGDDLGETSEDESEAEAETQRLPQEASAISKQLLKGGGGRHRGNAIHRRQGGQNVTGIPDTLSVLTDLTGANRLLKHDRNSLMVTKKEYLKKDWCKTEPIVQRIREEGCLSRAILNRFCYGQCNSFYIPKNPPKRKRGKRRGADEDSDDSHAFKSCGFCKPKKFSWIFVTLKCPGSTPQFRKKRVHRIKQCKCLAENVDA